MRTVFIVTPALIVLLGLGLRATEPKANQDQPAKQVKKRSGGPADKTAKTASAGGFPWLRQGPSLPPNPFRRRRARLPRKAKESPSAGPAASTEKAAVKEDAAVDLPPDPSPDYQPHTPPSADALPPLDDPLPAPQDDSPAREDAAAPAVDVKAADAANQAGAAQEEPSSEPPSEPQAELSPREQATMLSLRHAQEQTKRAFGIATRGALYTARTEFIRTLTAIAGALDAHEQTADHSTALLNGLRALDEADDFIPRGNALNADVNVPLLVNSHVTPVLKSQKKLTPLMALRQYYTYAQQQLSAAVEPAPVGSMALHGLGKLYVLISKEHSPRVTDAATKAIVLQQAALLCNPRNWQAANELGVLLARNGRNQEAEAWFHHSLSLSPHKETWHNLSVVHQRLGQEKLAQQARRKMAALGGPRLSRAPDVKWVEPDQMPRVADISVRPKRKAVAAGNPSAGRATAKKKKASPPSENSDGGRPWSWLPWN